jgi:hypothetical protein
MKPTVKAVRGRPPVDHVIVRHYSLGGSHRMTKNYLYIGRASIKKLGIRPASYVSITLDNVRKRITIAPESPGGHNHWLDVQSRLCSSDLLFIPEGTYYPVADEPEGIYELVTTPE